MTEEKDAKQEEAETSTESSTEENEQAATVSEDAKTQEAVGKDYQTKYQEAVAALREERAKRKELESQTREVVQNVQPVQQEDDTYKRFLIAEADAKIAKLMATDPSFKDRVEFVEDFVREGYDITTADMMAKAKIMDLISRESQKQEVEQKKIINLKTNASEEETNVSAPNYQDLVSGKYKDNPEAESIRLAMERFRNK